MRILLSIFLILSRIYIGYHVLAWIIAKSVHSELHSVSEIEIYIVLIVFDTWVAKSQDNIDIKITKNEEN